MPLDMKKRLSEARLTIDVEGDTLNIVYRPKRLTKALASEIDELTEDAVTEAVDAASKPAGAVPQEKMQEMFNTLAEATCEMVIDWDLLMDGVKIPLQVEAVKEATDMVLLAIIVQRVRAAIEASYSPNV